MSDDFDFFLFSQFATEAVSRLMSGNDTQCFSTEQFHDSYVAVLNETFNVAPPTPPPMPRDTRRHQLELIGAIEVSDDIWTVSELPESD